MDSSKYSEYDRKIKNNIGLEGFWTDNRIDEEEEINSPRIIKFRK